MTDRDELLDRTGEALGDALASRGVRGAADALHRLGRVSVDPDTRAVTIDIDAGSGGGRRSRNAPPDPAHRDVRLEGYLGPGDPDERWAVPYGYGSVDLGKRTFSLAFEESAALADLAAALIERDARLAPIAAWETHLIYRWGEDLGKEGSGLRVWRLRKPNPDTAWALGQGVLPRATDLLLDLNARVARHAEFTGWQVQAELHEALGCVKVRDGKLTIEPLSDYWRDVILRHYGVWRPSLVALQEVMAAAQREQLPLWEDEGEGAE